MKMVKFTKTINQKDKKAERWTEINEVEKENDKVRRKITIDSGAEESMWPKEMVEQEDVVETEVSRRGIGFVAANGSKMRSCGAMKTTFQEGGKARSMNAHVTDVKKPLGSVYRIADQKRNLVCFGPEPQHNFIMTIQTGEKMMLTREKR